MGEKRGRPFDHHGGGRGGYQSFKKQRPNEYHDRNRPQHSNGPSHPQPSGRPAHLDKTNPVLAEIWRLPDPKKCEPCRLAKDEMQSGLIALLDGLVQEEVGESEGDEIIQHARELRRLLSSRAEKALPSKSRSELDAKQPEKEKMILIPKYTEKQIKAAKDLPPLPPITEPHLEEAVFTHTTANQAQNAKALNPAVVNYDRLEFLGDAYLEVIASRLIYSRFPDLAPSEQSYFREQLVKNETLAQFSNGYGFGDRLKHGAHTAHSKNWGKIVADVFEAYVAAIVLSDPENGYATAENWLTELWAPQLLNYKVKPVDNPRAREDIQKLLMGKGIKLDYREERSMQMIEGKQNFYIGVYLTGWGFEDEWLGSGEGQNKSQACVCAAQNALETSMDVISKANKKKLEVYPPKPKADESETKGKETANENATPEKEKKRDREDDDEQKTERKKKKKSKETKETSS
jgi:ribonuclease-3